MKTLIKLEENSNINMVGKIYEFIDPTKIYIPILINSSFHKNDYIYKNNYFGNYISSISGNVSGSKQIFLNKKFVNALEVTNDFKENSHIKRKKKKITNREELIDNLKRFCLFDLIDKIDDNKSNLIVSCVDEEEYSINEFMRLSNNYDEILMTIDFLGKILKIKNITLAIKNTNAKSIKNVKSIIGSFPNIKIVLLPDNYLIGLKTNLCEFLNLKEDDSLLLTTNEIFDLYMTSIKFRDITEKYVTISGDALTKSFLINVKLGTSLKEIIKKYCKIKVKEYNVYVNGYMQGINVNKEDIIITKEINTIVINKNREEATECINCGACYKICPVSINPKRCFFNKVINPKCIGCGLCNYICPANIDLKRVVKGDMYEEKEN